MSSSEYNRIKCPVKFHLPMSDLTSSEDEVEQHHPLVSSATNKNVKFHLPTFESSESKKEFEFDNAATVLSCEPYSQKLHAKKTVRLDLNTETTSSTTKNAYKRGITFSKEQDKQILGIFEKFKGLSKAEISEQLSKIGLNCSFHCIQRRFFFLKFSMKKSGKFTKEQTDELTKAIMEHGLNSTLVSNSVKSLSRSQVRGFIHYNKRKQEKRETDTR
jgi:hypothetical protein